MTRNLIILAGALLGLAAAPVYAQAPSLAPSLRQGARVRVEAPGVVRNRFVGTLLFPPADSLVLGSEGGPPITLRTSQLTSLEVSTGRSATEGGLRGLLIGAPVGGILGALFSRGGEVKCLDCAPSSTTVQDALIMGAVGGGAGFLMGALVGREHWRRVPLTPDR